jgi:hypothetical protein
VEEIEEGMSSAEFSEWLAYFAILAEPVRHDTAAILRAHFAGRIVKKGKS